MFKDRELYEIQERHARLVEQHASGEVDPVGAFVELWDAFPVLFNRVVTAEGQAGHLAALVKALRAENVKLKATVAEQKALIENYKRATGT